MRNRRAELRGKFAVVAVLIGLGGAVASAAELNALTGLEVKPSAEGAQVVLRGTKAPTFTVFRLNDPDRLVVDVSSADASGVKGHHEGAGPISGVVASQFSDERASVARVLVALKLAAQYDVRANGNDVVISIAGGAPAVPASVAEAPAPVEAKAAVAAPAPAETSAAQVAESAPVANDVVRSRVDEIEVAHPARKITSLSYARGTLQIRADGEVAKYEVIELTNPPRLAIDVYGVGSSARAPKLRSAEIDSVRIGAHAEKVRLVVDTRGEMPEYLVERSPAGLRLLVGSAAVARKGGPEKSVAAKKTAVAAVEPKAEIEIDGQPVAVEDRGESAPIAAKPKAAPSVDVVELAFRESSVGGRLELKLSGEAATKVERPDEKSAVLTIDAARLPKRLERSLDTSALGSPVKMISAFPLPGPGERVRIAVAADAAFDDALDTTRDGLSWKFTARAGKAPEQVAVAPKVAGFADEASSYASQGAPRQRAYSGKRVSFEFKDIDIHNLLRVIAEVSKKNIVVADDVTGKVTIRLRNVPWDQALELILRSKGLGKEEMGTIVRVAPLKTLEEEAETRRRRRESLVKQEELVVQLVPVNYASAADMQARVKEVLSERGNVTVDTRTNVLIVRDISSNIHRARQLVQSLDTQTPQVLIESRIVEASTSFSRQIGVQWGGSASAAPGTGNPTGLIFPNFVGVRGGSSSEANIGTAADPNFAVNLPAAVGTGSGGALGFVFGSAGGALALNLRLSALENEGQVKTISAPKVTTLDNNTAKISQGVSLPFSQVSSSGVNTTFVEARLQLEVTPHITQDGSVLMAIRAENNQPDPSNSGANGQPAIQRKEANTQVMVKDGDTTVIGGIYVRRGSSSEAGVPFLSKIPILGFFFKNNTESESRQELLIFITPRILNRQTIAQTL